MKEERVSGGELKGKRGLSKQIHDNPQPNPTPGKAERYFQMTYPSGTAKNLVSRSRILSPGPRNVEHRQMLKDHLLRGHEL